MTFIVNNFCRFDMTLFANLSVLMDTNLYLSKVNKLTGIVYQDKPISTFQNRYRIAQYLQ